MKKRVFSTEAAYLLGLVILSLGTALMERADFGMSMVVAPAYLLHLKISQFLPFFSFGMAEYTLQAVLLIVLALVMRRARAAYLFSFVTAVIYGFLLDGALALIVLLPANGFVLRAVFYTAGLLLCSLGVCLLFQTYLPPEAYELFVKEIAHKWGLPISKTKTAYDCISCAAAVVLSFLFFGFGHFEGVQWGTILCALVNGWLIGRCSALIGHFWRFEDTWPLRSKFAD